MLEDEQNKRYLNKIIEVLVLKGAGFHNIIFSADVITLPLNSGVFGT